MAGFRSKKAAPAMPSVVLWGPRGWSMVERATVDQSIERDRSTHRARRQVAGAAEPEDCKVPLIWNGIRLRVLNAWMAQAPHQPDAPAREVPPTLAGASGWNQTPAGQDGRHSDVQ